MSARPSPIVPDLRRTLSARVLGPDSSVSFTQDFGHRESRLPAAVVCAPEVDDVQRLLDFARARGIPVVVRGSGHSCAGQSLTTGIVIATHGLGQVVIPAESAAGDRFVRISAGLQWNEVERQLAPAARQIPILADHLGLSVGGTLSVGCYGADSLRFGALVHQIRRIRLTTPDGVTLWCSEGEHSEIFAAVLAGLGRFGVVHQVEINTVPRRRWNALHSYRAGSLRELAGMAIEAAQDDSTIDLFKALFANGRYAATCGSYHSSAMAALQAPSPLPRKVHLRWIAPDYRRWRSAAVKLWVGRYAGMQNLWSDYLLDANGLIRFCEYLDSSIKDRVFGDSLKAVYLLPVRHSTKSQAVLEGSTRLAGSMAYGIGLYTMVHPSDPVGYERTRLALRDMLTHAIESGGAPYLYGHHELTTEECRSVYGAAWPRLEALKKRLDPDGLFGNEITRL